MKNRAYPMAMAMATVGVASVLVSSAAHADDFVHDKANRLVKRVQPNRVTTYAYDGEGNLTKECTGSSEAALTCSRIFVDAGHLPHVLGKVTGTTETLYAYGPGGVTAQQTVEAGTAQGVEYALTDHQGTVRGLVSSAGVVSARTSYDAYGAVRSKVGPSTSAIGYTGEYTGTDGTVWLRARSYVPELGRFAQRDTYVVGAEGTQGLNRYAYAGNNPVNVTDPSGHFSIKDAWNDFLKGLQRANRRAIGVVEPQPAPTCTSESEKWGEALGDYGNSPMLGEDINRIFGPGSGSARQSWGRSGRGKPFRWPWKPRPISYPIPPGINQEPGVDYGDNPIKVPIESWGSHRVRPYQDKGLLKGNQLYFPENVRTQVLAGHGVKGSTDTFSSPLSDSPISVRELASNVGNPQVIILGRCDSEACARALSDLTDIAVTYNPGGVYTGQNYPHLIGVEPWATALPPSYLKGKR